MNKAIILVTLSLMGFLGGLIISHGIMSIFSTLSGLALVLAAMLSYQGITK